MENVWNFIFILVFALMLVLYVVIVLMDNIFNNISMEDIQTSNIDQDISIVISKIRYFVYSRQRGNLTIKIGLTNNTLDTKIIKWNDIYLQEKNTGLKIYNQQKYKDRTLAIPQHINVEYKIEIEKFNPRNYLLVCHWQNEYHDGQIVIDLSPNNKKVSVQESDITISPQHNLLNNKQDVCAFCHSINVGHSGVCSHCGAPAKIQA